MTMTLIPSVSRFICFVGLILATYSTTIKADETETATDTSGTNPAVILRSASLYNEYADLQSGSYLNTSMFRYIEPFADGAMSIRLSVPTLFSDATGSDELGSGDVSLKWSWISHVDTKNAWLLSAEVYAPTGDEDFGTEKWTIAPGITYARFIGKNIIAAPAVVHNISFAGDSNRQDVRRTDIDLYMVYTASDKSWWITSDFTLSIDHENDDRTPMSWEAQYGRSFGKFKGAAVNAYIRPGIGIGSDRFNDWNFEFGISLIGF